MADLNLRMSLTLADAASGPLRGFVAVLEQIRTVAAGLGRQLEGVATGVTAVSRAGAAGDGAIAGMTGALMSMEAVLTGVMGRLTQVATGLTAVGAEGRAAGAGVRAGAAQMEGGLAATNAQAGTLMSTMKGLAALYAAMEVKKGLTTSITEATEFQRTENRLTNMNESAEGSAFMRESARKVGREFPQFNQNELLEMVIDLRQITGNAHEAGEALSVFAKTVFAINLSLPSGKKLGPQDTLSLAKITEMAGVSMDPTKRDDLLNQITQIVAATQGRVNVANLFGNLSYAKGGEGRSILGDPQSLRTFAALIEEDSIGGGTGGRVGNMVTQLVNAITKSRAITTKNRDEWLETGLVDPGMVNINKNTNRVTSIKSGAIAGEITQIGYARWVDEFLRPALMKLGVDMNDPGQVKKKTDVLFPNTNAAEAAFQLLTRKDLIAKQTGMMANTAGRDEQVERGAKLAAAAFERFHKAVDNLAIAIGTTLLPVITPLVSGLANLITKLGDFSTAHPIFGFMVGLAGAVAVVQLGIFGFSKLFGPLSAMLLGTGAAAGGMSAGVAAAGAGIATAVGFIMKWMLRLIPLVGLVLLAWDFAPLIANLNVGGKRIGDWATEVCDWVVNKFRQSWNVIGAIVNSVRPGTMEIKTTGATGTWDAPFATGGGGKFAGTGATGTWGDAKPAQNSIDALLAANKAAAKGLGGGKERKGRAGRFANYDAELDGLKNAYRLAEDEAKRAADSQERQYKANLISANDYFDKKLEALKASVAAEIVILEKEKAAFDRIGDKAGAARVATDIKIKQGSLETGATNIEIERGAALKKLDQEALEVQRELLKTSGQRRAAEAQRIQDELKGKLDGLVLNKQITRVEADAMMAQAQANVALKKQQSETAILQEEYKRDLIAIDAAERNGTMTGTKAAQLRLALHKQEAAALNDLLAKELALELARNEGRETETSAKLRTAIAQNDATLNQINPDTTSVLKATQNGFEGFFRSIMSGTKSVKSAFKDLGQSIADSINNIIAKRLGDALFESLFPPGSGSAGRGGGGGLNSLLSSLLGGGKGGGGGFNLGSMLGGGAGNFGIAGSGWFSQMMAPTTIAGTSMSFADGLAAGIIPLAVGTNYVPRDMLAMLHEGESVTPKAYNPAAGGVDKAMQVTNNFHLPGQIDRRTQQQIAVSAGQGLRRAQARD